MSRSFDAEELYLSAACGLLTTELNGSIQRVNAVLCDWLGYAAEELVDQRRFQDLLAVGSKFFHQSHWLPLLLMQGSVEEVQFELLHRDGRALVALANARIHGAMIPQPGVAPAHVNIAIFVALDRTKYERELLLARRQAEALLESERQAQQALAAAEAQLRSALTEREASFRTLAENSPDVIARFDRAYRCVYLNHSRGGVRPIEAFVGKPIDELGLPEQAAASMQSALAEAFLGRESSVAFRFKIAEGAWRELQAHVVPELDARGEVATVLAISRDVTALRAQELQARQRAQVAEQLMGIVSHDLRNPLNAMQLGAQSLLGSELSAHQRRLLERISSSADRANRLATDLLDFAQARLGGGLRVERDEVSLHDVVAEALDEIKPAHPERRLAHVCLGSGSGLADAHRIAQVVGNLVNNALKYGAPDQPVTVTSEISSGSLELRVHNLGHPIPSALQEQLFQPFRRGAQNAKLGSRGVGLGLYIVSEIANAHGGDVSVDSNPADGTTFSVKLPRA